MKPGLEHSGVRRYAEVIADGLRAIEATEVLDLQLTLNGRGRAGIGQARALRSRMRGASAGLVSYSRWHTWSPGPLRVVQLVIVLAGLRRRSVTVLHDVYPPGGPQRIEWWALAMVMMFSGAVVVHTEEERRNLHRLPGARSSRVHVIEHFVLERTELPDRAASRAAYSVPPGVTVAGLVGWLNPRKNFELAIEALAQLDGDVQLWFIGGVSEHLDWYETQLRDRACELGVADRVTFTGPVSETELEQRLAAVDIGVCPYRRISASGSVSTLLGARRPIVVTEVEFSRVLRDLAPEVVSTIRTLDAEKLAAAISEAASRSTDPSAFDPILESRSVGTVARRYRALLAATV